MCIVDPSMLLDHNLVVANGHDEYWSREMRTAFETARDSGVNIAFMASNTSYWQVRYENSEQTLVGYKVDPGTAGNDPSPIPPTSRCSFASSRPLDPSVSYWVCSTWIRTLRIMRLMKAHTQLILSKLLL